MEDFQQRVVTEKEELDAKIVKLEAFVNNEEKYGALDEDAQNLLEEQLDVMQQYSNILDERIKAF